MAFVIVPYTDRFNLLHQSVIKPALNKFGIVPRRADDIVTGERISNKVSEMISGSDIIICDVSEINANVFFEIGLARAQNKNIIVLCDEATNPPSDFDGMDILRYSNRQFDWEALLVEKLKNILENSEFSNRIYEFSEESSLDIYIKYKNLTLREITGFLHNLDRVHQSLMSATSSTYYIQEIDQKFEHTLLVDRAYTGNSVNFSFKEGWLPSLNFEGQDLDIQVPRKLGIPALLGVALLTAANQALDTKNKYLDSQIKEIDLKLKEIEYNKKLQEKSNRAVKLRAKKVVKQLSASTNIVHVEINNIPIIGLNERKNNA